MLTEPPANPFHEISSQPGRRTLEYEHLLQLPNANGKKINLQLWEGMDTFSQVAALYDRCLWFERRCAELEAENASAVHEEFLEIDEPEQPRMSRLEQLTAFLRESGPMHRSDIAERSGIPVGTLSAILNDDNFGKDEDGRWMVKPE